MDTFREDMPLVLKSFLRARSKNKNMVANELESDSTVAVLHPSVTHGCL